MIATCFTFLQAKGQLKSKDAKARAAAAGGKGRRKVCVPLLRG